MKQLRFLKILFAGISLYMTYLVFSTAAKSDLFSVSIEEPWFTTTLIDFYLIILVLAVWVIYKEKTMLARILWILAFVSTGAIAVGLYVLIQLIKLKPGDSFDRVLLPAKRKENNE